jgi:transposase
MTKKQQLYKKDYTIYERKKQVKIEKILEELIAEDDVVRLLNAIMGELDYTEVYRAYAKEWRKPKTSPAAMFKVLIYGGTEGKYAGSEVSKSCRRDINYIWLLGGEDAPDDDALNRFRGKKLSETAEGLFYQLVKKLREMDEIKYEHLFVDGSKTEANANKYSFVWRKSVSKHSARLEAKLVEYLSELKSRYGETETAVEMLSRIESMRTEPFVHGRGKRKSELQRDTEQLIEMLSRREKYEKYNATFNGRNSFSKTDPDATFMRMKDDHMRNSQLKPGYNVQLGVEGEYIVGVELSSERSDNSRLIPLLENIESHIGAKYGDVTADAGYESEENYTYFEEKQQICYIKPQNYERNKTRKFKSDMNLRENMPYDAEKDEYTCKNGKILRAVYTGKSKSATGFESEVTFYECEDCSGCPHKKTCTRAKDNRKIRISKNFLRQRNESLSRITSEKGVLLRVNRSIQVEGAFGVIKHDYGFRQFLLRGYKKVRTELFIVAFAYNINKLHHKIQQNRTGSQLFENFSA